MRADHHTHPPLAARGRLALTETELVAWGERLGRSLRAPIVVALTGELGTGKTTLAQAICRGYGVTSPVTSPTYALVHEYESPHGTVYHADLYRLEGEAELDNIGWTDFITAHAVVIVEWPERAGARLPADHLPIALDYDPEDAGRRILLAG